MTEGQSPAHFARQMIRFLRNALVAKVTGDSSPLLQISADERGRVARIAALFSEEDLTRFLQIMLRSYNDITYRADPRFHLELALLKLVHAQRLLPIEELLSGAGEPRSSLPGRPKAESANVPRTADVRETGSRFGEAVTKRTSPFEQDRSRKSQGPELAAG